MSDILHQLRARREQLARRAVEYFDVPGHPGMVAQVTGLDYPDIKRFVDPAMESHQREVEASTDLIAYATASLHFRDQAGLTPLREWLEPQITDEDVLNALASHGDEPLRFDDRLAAVFAIDADTARGVVAAVIPSDVARVEFAGLIVDWARTRHLQVAETAAGE